MLNSAIQDDIVETAWREIVAETVRFRERDSAILGCRFLYSPKRTFFENTGLLVAGINPGREIDMRDRPYPEQEMSAFLYEDWGTGRYRYSILELMRGIYRHYAIENTDEAISATLTSNFLPFRSGRFSEISKDTRNDIIRFSTRMWQKLIPLTGIRAVLCSGQAAWDGMYAVCRHVGLPTPVSVPHGSHHSFGAWCIEHAIRQLEEIGFVPNAR